MEEDFKDLRVSDLIDPEVDVWDFVNVNTMFDQVDCEVILRIPRNNLDSEDIPVWQGHAKGLFTVNGAYKLTRMLETANNTEATTNRHQTFKYNQIWSIDVPKKINHFIFRAIHNRLATTDNLIKRGVIVPNICSLCQNDSEDIMHVFYHCRISREVHQNIQVNNFTSRVMDFKELFSLNGNRLPRDVFKLWIVCIWDISYQRNLIIRKKPFKSPMEIVKFGKDYLERHIASPKDLRSLQPP
ncbi:hypothetical protein LIER_34780 [Lithospermum erythrorhizon]|uniref:Reverse transcriptase zinc-binding domain-containing protein n=1 Tax=Lithospermum erythrorhizon TaxID=34254 RepID=A0AAV3S1U3_LITER